MKVENASRWGTLFAALLGVNLLVACGGGGDGQAGPSNIPPQNNTPAPETVGGNTYTFYFGVEGTRSVIFNDDNVTWVETRDGAPIVGTYRYNRIDNGNSADLVLIEDSV